MVGFISMILLFNIYSIIFNFQFIFLLPIIIQLTLLSLIFIKHFSVQLLLKIWSMVFLVVASALSLSGKILIGFSNDFKNFNFADYLPKVILLFIGLIIYIGSQKTIIINKDNSQT